MFEELLKANEKIREDKDKYGLNAEEVFILQILKIVELEDVSYEDFRKSLIEKKISEK